MIVAPVVNTNMPERESELIVGVEFHRIQSKQQLTMLDPINRISTIPPQVAEEALLPLTTTIGEAMINMSSSKC